MTRFSQEMPRSPRGPCPAGGFTLVELMVTIAVVAIMVAIAVPSFDTLMQRNRMATAANEIVSALQTARMEAVRRNRRAVLCPTTDGRTCAGTDWLRMVVFVDDNANATPDAGEAIIREVQAARSDLGITAGSANNRIWFRPDGRVSVGAANTATLALTSSKLPAGESRRLIEVAVSRVSVCTASGTATTCP
jgi:type IV fimbrial biogenesis protein FimT